MSDCLGLRPGDPKSKRQSKDDRIAELEEEVRRLKRDLAHEKRSRVLIDPKTGRERDLICRRRGDRWPADIIRKL